MFKKFARVRDVRRKVRRRKLIMTEVGFDDKKELIGRADQNVVRLPEGEHV